MCLVRLELKNFSFFSKGMALLLFCISLFFEILYPCASMKYLDHSILDMESSTIISSSSVELFPFIFCFVEKLDTNNFPRDIMDPFCHWQSLCNAYEASTHHFTSDMSLTLKIIFSSLVSLRYFKICLSFPQSYLSGLFKRAVINATVICMSWCAPSLMNSSCDTVWWKVCSKYSGTYCFLTLSRTGKRW